MGLATRNPCLLVIIFGLKASCVREGETHRIRAVGVDDVQRVHAVAEGFTHLLPFAVLNHRVDEHVGERQAVTEVDVEHHHARDPERENLARGGERVGRVPDVKRAVAFFVRPGERGDRPERRGEPGVEDVGVLHAGLESAHRRSSFEGGISETTLECLGPFVML